VYRQAVAECRRAMKAFHSTYEDAVLFLKHCLGRDNPRLAEFGVALPQPRRPLTAEANALSGAKAAATRRARAAQLRVEAPPPERRDGEPEPLGAE
jgi:hypothetical protein